MRLWLALVAEVFSAVQVQAVAVVELHKVLLM
jgi:hypothetical protein